MISLLVWSFTVAFLTIVYIAAYNRYRKKMTDTFKRMNKAYIETVVELETFQSMFIDAHKLVREKDKEIAERQAHLSTVLNSLRECGKYRDQLHGLVTAIDGFRPGDGMKIQGTGDSTTLGLSKEVAHNLLKIWNMADGIKNFML